MPKIADASCASGARVRTARPLAPPTFVYDPVDVTGDASINLNAACSIEKIIGEPSLDRIATDEAAGASNHCEIGSGICVDPTGLILTAGHVAPTVGALRVVAFADGITHWGQCIAVEQKWDLALLQLHPRPNINSATSTKHTARSRKKRQKVDVTTEPQVFPSVVLSRRPPKPKDVIWIVGQPGRPRGERLEAGKGRVTTLTSDPLATQDNVEADGGLAHSCEPLGSGSRMESGARLRVCNSPNVPRFAGPAFAGNSGSGLLLASTGCLIGIHTGYNDRKYAYHGTTLEAIAAFLKPYKVQLEKDEAK